MSTTVIRQITSTVDAATSWAIAFDSVLSEAGRMSTHVTSHPVASGAPVSDHAYDEQPKLTLKAVVSDVLPTRFWAGMNGKSQEQLEKDGFAPQDPYTKPGQTRSQAALERIEQLRASHELCYIQTGLKLWKDMLCTSVEYETDERTAEVLAFTAEFVGIRIVKTLITKYPPTPKKGAWKNKDKGKVETKEPSPAQQRQAFVERQVAKGRDRALAEKVAADRYPDPSGQANLLKGGEDP